MREKITRLVVGALAVVPTLASAFPDPAWVACNGAHGIYTVVDMDKYNGPQSSLCRLPDNGVISSSMLMKWAEPRLAVKAFLETDYNKGTGPVETWASAKCSALGGTVKYAYEHGRPETRYTICTFEDTSSIDAWTLFQGPRYHRLLEQALKAVN